MIIRLISGLKMLMYFKYDYKDWKGRIVKNEPV